jgi:hypothetical protein
MHPPTDTILLGIGATLVLDAWCVVRQPLLGQAPADYAPIGRWVAHMARGRFRHADIARAARMRGERALGWLVHYLVGIGFAVLLSLLAPAWLGAPTIGTALAFGLATVLVPWLVVMPALGAGIAASRSRDPAAARRQSIATHLAFGLGLHAAGLALHAAHAA